MNNNDPSWALDAPPSTNNQTNGGSMSGSQDPSWALNTPPVATPTASPILGQQWLGNAVDTVSKFLPVGLGTAGAVLGTPFDAISGPAGTIAGAGGGGALGQILENYIRQNITHTQNPESLSQNAMDVGKSGVTNALFGAIPGLGEGAPLLGKLALRGLGGAGVSGVSQAIDNYGKPQDQQGSIPKAMIGGGIANEIIPGLGDALGPIAKYLGKNIPADITNVTETVPNQLKASMEANASNETAAMQQELADEMVHPKFSSLAKSEGIIDPTLPATADDFKQSLALAKAFGGETETGLQKLINGRQVSIGDYIDKMREIIAKQGASPEKIYATEMINKLENDLNQSVINKSTPGKVSPEISTTPSGGYPKNEGNTIVGDRVLPQLKRDMRKSALTKGAFKDVTPPSQPIKATSLFPDSISSGPATNGGLGGAQSGNAKVDLKLINDFKKGPLHDNYNNDGPSLFNNLYKNTADYVEKNSSNPIAVKALNQKSFGLSSIAKNIDKHLNGSGAIFRKYSPQAFDKVTNTEGIAKAVKAEANKPVSSLGSLKEGLADTISLPAYGAMGWFGGQMGRHLGNTIADKLLQTVESKQNLGRNLSSGYDAITPGANNLLKVLQQLGVRAPISGQQ